MSPKTSTTLKWALASYVLRDAFTDFILTRQAIPCSARTMGFYNYILAKFITWLDLQGVSKPEDVTARLVRSYLAELTARGLADTTLHGNARAIRTLVRFWHEEGYMEAVKFSMPKLTQKRLPVLTTEQAILVLCACHKPRDKAIMNLIIDTGTRLNETVSLNWGDVDIVTGLVRVGKGKGGKARSVVVGVVARRVLLAYRRT